MDGGDQITTTLSPKYLAFSTRTIVSQVIVPKGGLLLHLVSLVDDSKVVGQLPQSARDLSLGCFRKLESSFGRPPLGSAAYSRAVDTNPHHDWSILRTIIVTRPFALRPYGSR